MTDHELHDLAPLYAIDALDDDERRAFEHHLDTCGRCQAEVNAHQETAAVLGEEAAVDPPNELREQLLAQLPATPQLTGPAPPDSREGDDGTDSADETEQAGELAPVLSLPARLSAAASTTRGRVVTAAAAAVIVVGLAAGVASRDGGDSSTGDELAAVLAAEDASRAELAPTTPEDGADPATGMIEVVWSPDRDQVAVVATELAEPGAGQTYALWLLVDDEAVPAALFTPADGRVSAVFTVEDRVATGWGVTLEPEGGSDAPTTPVLFSGTS